MDEKHNNIGHNYLNNNDSVHKNLKTTKKGFYVNYDKAGYRIDHYNTNIFRRLARKVLIKIGIFEPIKNIKKIF